MEAFEKIVSEALERQGYWTRNSFKVDLRSEDKRAIGKPSSPRWELDVIAYKPSVRKILVVECKSYLDSHGVRLEAFENLKSRFAERYKLFNDSNLRRVILRRLRSQLRKAGLCQSGDRMVLCLAAGKFKRPADKTQLHKLFAAKGWRLLDDDWIRESLTTLSSSGYENSEAAVVTKLLLRGRGPRSKQDSSA